MVGGLDHRVTGWVGGFSGIDEMVTAVFDFFRDEEHLLLVKTAGKIFGKHRENSQASSYPLIFHPMLYVASCKHVDNG